MCTVSTASNMIQNIMENMSNFELKIGTDELENCDTVEAAE